MWMVYFGIQAEGMMLFGPGSGICYGYTMARVLLGDAIALVRRDRFYTSDYAREIFHIVFSRTVLTISVLRPAANLTS